MPSIFFFGFVLYFYSLHSDDFYQKGIEFPSLEDRVHTCEAGKAVQEKAIHIHVLPWPDTVLVAKKGEVLSCSFICMYSVSLY